ELAGPEPITVAEAQRLLAPDEVLLVYARTGATQPVRREDDFVWLVRPNRAEWRRLDLAPGELGDAVRALRAQLDPGQWKGGAAPFRGIGDPALTGPVGPTRNMDVARLLTRGLADPTLVRSLPPLPETAEELRTLARELGAGEDSLLLREKATETAAKHGALA